MDDWQSHGQIKLALNKHSDKDDLQFRKGTCPRRQPQDIQAKL